jgi:PAS domain S-box-containing protein
MEIHHLSDLLDVVKLQQLQDLFSEATGVASIITTPTGEPITMPSNFCSLCSSIIRKTEKGLANCIHSDAELGRQDVNGPRISTCLSGGLWDAGVSINVGGVHLANWLIGQVRNESQNMDEMLKYADEIGANRNEFLKELKRVPVMSKERFEKVAKMLYAFVNEYTEKSISNVQLQQAIALASKREEELAKERMLMNALMDNIPDQIYFKDRESRFIRSNMAQARKFNVKDPSFIIGKTDADFFSHEHSSGAFNDEQMIIERGISLTKEEKETWPDRPDTWVSTTKAPLRDLEGNIIGTLGISRNITERKVTELQLIQNEEQFRTIVENMGEGLAIVDQEENFTFTNPKADEIFGVEKGGLVGHNLKEYLSQEQLSIVLDQTEQRKEGNISLYEIEIVRKSGEKRLLLVTSVPKIDVNGFFQVAYGVFRDITERKENELLIQNKNKELQELNSQKDKLFSIISHDLRSPFNSFLGLTELLERDVEGMERDEIRAIAYNLRNSAVRIYDLLSNLLEWSRLQRGLITIFPQCFLLNDVVKQCCDALNDVAINKSITLENTIADDLEITADPNMIQIITHNLLTNALKFTPNGGRVAITAKHTNAGQLLISVADTGIGMSPDMLQNLFRLDTNNNRTGTNGEASSGLGLLLCNEFVEKHGGSIQVESAVNKGTTFTILLPLMPPKTNKPF